MKLKHIITETRNAELETAFDALIGRKAGVFIDTERNFIQTDYAGRIVNEKQVLGFLEAAGLKFVRLDEDEPEPGETKGYRRYHYK